MDGGDVGADVGVGGVEDIGGGEVGDDLAGIEEDDALGEVKGFVEIVSDEQDGFADALEQVAEHGLHLGTGEGIEGAEGLVHEENGGVGGEGAGEADALTLAAGELPGIAGAEFGEVWAGGVKAGESEDFGGAAGFLAGGMLASSRARPALRSTVM